MARPRLPAVETKVIAPVHLRTGVPRARLLSLFERQRPRVLCIVAPAGYGKTHLLAQWAWHLQEYGSKVAWLSLDGKDDNPQRFLTHLLRALETGEPALGGLLPVVADRIAGDDILQNTSQNAATAILNALARTPSPLTLVLDDAHYLDNAAGWPIVERLVREAPTHVHVAIAARVRPPLPVGRVRALGDLLEIDAAQLAFTEAETAEFLATQDIAPLPARAVSALHGKTEGWAAALQLTAIALRDGRNPESVIARIGGHDQRLSEYLFEDVFGNLPADIRDFLTHTAILERLHPGICDAVTRRRDSKSILAQVERLHLFLAPLDPERNWFRYHALFSEFLLRQLDLSEDSGDIASLHRRAGTWLLAHGHVSEAVNHLFAAGDHNGVVDILHKHCDELYYAGHYTDVLRWLEQLPMGLLHRHPRLLLNRVWALVHDWRFDEAKALIKTVRRISSRHARHRGRTGDGRRNAALDALTIHRQAMMLLIGDRLSAARDAWKKLLAGHAFADPYLQGSAHAAYALSQFGLYSWNSARDHIARAERLFRSSHQHCGKVWSDSFTAMCWIGVGEPNGVEELLRQAMASAIGHSSANSPFAALPALPLADFLYERDRTGEARQLIQTHLDTATTLGTVDQLIAGYITAMRLAARDGAVSEAESTFRRALTCADRHDFPRLRAHAVEERLRQLLQGGEWSVARMLAESENLLGSRESMMPGRTRTSQDEARALAWARMAFAQRDAEGARAVLTRWTDFARQRGYRRTAIRFGAALAVQLHLSGRTDEAIDALWEALRAAAVTGALRPFVDEGNILARILQDLPERRLLSPQEAVHAQKLLGAFAHTTAPQPRAPAIPASKPGRLSLSRGPVEALKRREREILRRIARGMTNREIAIDLSLSVGTINWYVHQMYQKLGVHRRTHAVICGKAFGYLDRPNAV